MYQQDKAHAFIHYLWDEVNVRTVPAWRALFRASVLPPLVTIALDLKACQLLDYANHKTILTKAARYRKTFLGTWSFQLKGSQKAANLGNLSRTSHFILLASPSSHPKHASAKKARIPLWRKGLLWSKCLPCVQASVPLLQQPLWYPNKIQIPIPNTYGHWLQKIRWNLVGSQLRYS